MLRKAEKQNTCFYFMSFLASLANKLISMLEPPTYYIIDPRIHKSNIINSVTMDRMHVAYKKTHLDRTYMSINVLQFVCYQATR